jgi:hypothetical protein
MHAAKSGGNIGGAGPCLTRPKAVFGFISRLLVKIGDCFWRRYASGKI